MFVLGTSTFVWAAAAHHVLGLVPAWVVTRAGRDLAARHLHVRPRRPDAHPVQHADAVDVRDRARTHLGHALFPEVLLHRRDRRGHPDHGARVAAAVRARWRSCTASDIVGASGASTVCCSRTRSTFPIADLHVLRLSRFRRGSSSSSWGRLAFLSSMSDNGGGVANATHLGGLLVAYVYLKGLRMRLSPWAK